MLLLVQNVLILLLFSKSIVKKRRFPFKFTDIFPNENESQMMRKKKC